MVSDILKNVLTQLVHAVFSNKRVVTQIQLLELKGYVLKDLHSSCGIQLCPSQVENSQVLAQNDRRGQRLDVILWNVEAAEIHLFGIFSVDEAEGSWHSTGTSALELLEVVH